MDSFAAALIPLAIALLASLALGRAAAHFGVPRVTLYLLAGLALGPQVGLHFFGPESGVRARSCSAPPPRSRCAWSSSWRSASSSSGSARRFASRCCVARGRASSPCRPPRWGDRRAGGDRRPDRDGRLAARRDRAGARDRECAECDAGDTARGRSRRPRLALPDAVRRPQQSRRAAGVPAAAEPGVRRRPSAARRPASCWRHSPAAH